MNQETKSYFLLCFAMALFCVFCVFLRKHVLNWAVLGSQCTSAFIVLNGLVIFMGVSVCRVECSSALWKTY